MATFTARNISASDVPVDAATIWPLITNPKMLAELTPLVKAITVDGDDWRWQLAGIDGFGISVTPTFTERMTFEPMKKISFTHAPPHGEKERAGAEGTYVLTRLGPESTRLKVDLTLSVELPLPRFSAGAVERVIAATMERTGRKFASNLYEHLGLDPNTVHIEQLHA
ncbi:MAG TPA: hypothetical protein PKV27_13500 [Ilumatobacteraceae bacterium]|nr:hypothetical protein [Ilumatobacteraceae bacterium]